MYVRMYTHQKHIISESGWERREGGREGGSEGGSEGGREGGRTDPLCTHVCTHTSIGPPISK